MQAPRNLTISFWKKIVTKKTVCREHSWFQRSRRAKNTYFWPLFTIQVIFNTRRNTLYKCAICIHLRMYCIPVPIPPDIISILTMSVDINNKLWEVPKQRHHISQDAVEFGQSLAVYCLRSFLLTDRQCLSSSVKLHLIWPINGPIHHFHISNSWTCSSRSLKTAFSFAIEVSLLLR